MKKCAILLAPLALAACGETPGAPSAQEGAPGLSGPNPPVPMAPADLAALRSEECVGVAKFYFEALSSGEYDRAALAWDDPVVDGARLKAVLGAYTEPQIAWQEPEVMIGEGMPTCTVRGTLTDAADADLAAEEGTVIFNRVPEAETNEGQASRWRIEGQTFIESLQRSGRGG